MTVKELMSTNICFVKADADVSDAAALMKKHDIGFVPVCDLSLIHISGHQFLRYDSNHLHQISQGCSLAGTAASHLEIVNKRGSQGRAFNSLQGLSPSLFFL